MSAACPVAPPGVSTTTGAPAARTTATISSGSMVPAAKLSCRSRPESNASFESFACTRSIRPVIALTRSTTSSRSSPPAWAWQVSRQKPTPNSPTASHSRASASNRRAHGVVAAGRVLDQDRQRRSRRRPRRRRTPCASCRSRRQVVALVDVPAVHDQALRARASAAAVACGISSLRLGMRIRLLASPR